MAHVEDDVLHVEVVYCPAAAPIDEVQLELPPGATLADALQASGLLPRHGLVAEHLSVGIWGQIRPAATPLRELDRVEIYRPLRVDPKEARRLRYRDQRVDGAKARSRG